MTAAELRSRLPRSLRAAKMYDLIDYLNALRNDAGLPPVRIYGTSKDAVVIRINRAERGDFAC